jgi:Fe-S cluster biogenesis protein NfuA
VLTVPHPLGGVDPEVIRAHARDAVDDLVAVITGTRAQRMATASFDELRATLRQDGGELTLLGVGRDSNGVIAEVALELLDAGCAECVMPKAFLEPLVLRALACEVDGLVRVELHDPRETPAP